MAKYAMVINFTLDDVVKSIVLDSVSETRINATSNIATHPMVSGDIVADHTIKQPITLDFSGKFSTKTAQSIVVGSDGAILADVEDLFERIKNESILCTLIKVKVDENSTSDSYEKNARFSVRKNMILHSINWTEEITTLNYSFGWQQVMFVDTEEFDVDLDDAFLPYITEPETKNFTDVLFDQNDFDVRVIDFMQSNKIATKNFLDLLATYSTSALIAVGVGVAIAVGLASALASIPGLNVALAIVAAIGILIYGLYKAFKRIDQRLKYKIKPFDVYKNKKKTEKEIQRFADFFNQLHEQIKEFNTRVFLYKIAENKQQECLLTIGNSYYVFSVLWNNTDQSWGIIASDMDDNIKGKMADIKGALKCIGDCKQGNALFKTQDGYSIYIMKPDDEADENDLTNYYILVSSIDLEKFDKMISEIIENAILK